MVVFGRALNRISEYVTNKGVMEAIQAKPILVWQGRNDIRADDGAHFNRVAIGVDDIGNIIVGALIGPNGQGGSLYEFAELLALGIDQGGPGITAALNMDGGPGAHIYFPSINYHVGNEGNEGNEVFNYTPNLLRFCSRC